VGEERGRRAIRARHPARYLQRGQCRTNPVNGALELAGLLSNFTMKNPFRRLFTPKDTRGTDEKLKDLEDRVRRVEEEWTEVYGKFRTLQMRVAKQVQRLDESSQEEPQREESAGQVAPGSTLSPRLAKIQQQILERRNRVVTTKDGE